MALTDPPPTHRDAQPFDRVEAIPPVEFETYGTGLCRRRIRLVNESDGLVVGELEDDFHHFRIELVHDGQTILEARGTPLRGPWSTCMEVGDPLRAIEGHPVSPRSTAVGSYAAATSNCTHLFDLTGLAIAHATRDQVERQYDLVVTDVVGERTELVVWRDGELQLHWVVDHGRIESPSRWAAAPLERRFIPWAEERFDADTAEAAIALRRMLHISGGRGMNLDEMDTAGGHTDGPVGRCYSYAPEVAVRAVRHRGSVRDFSTPDRAARLLSDMETRGVGP